MPVMFKDNALLVGACMSEVLEFASDLCFLFTSYPNRYPVPGARQNKTVFPLVFHFRHSTLLGLPESSGIFTPGGVHSWL